MGKAKKVVLVMERGDTPGVRFELLSNGYRAVGRAGDGTVTVQFTVDGDQALDREDLARLDEHLAKRGSRKPSQGDRMRIGSMRRGRDILLSDSKISRTHAMFFLDDDGPSVVDLFSTNGTRVNGQVVDDADLEEGDIVHIGRARFVVHYQ